MKKKKRLDIPADVPLGKASEYKNNLNKLTKNTGKLMLFAGDQKIEHLNKDFYGKGIAKELRDGGISGAIITAT